MAHVLSPSARRNALAFGEALFARSTSEAPPAERMRWFVDDLDDFVAHLNVRARRLFLLCLFVVTWVAPLLRFRLGRLGRLPLAERIEAVEAIERTPAALALFALRAVVSLVYYEHLDAAAEIGWDQTCLTDTPRYEERLVRLGKKRPPRGEAAPAGVETASAEATSTSEVDQASEAPS